MKGNLNAEKAMFERVTKAFKYLETPKLLKQRYWGDGKTIKTSIL